MTTTWARINLDEVDDMAPRFGMEAFGESRFLRDQVGAETIGASLYRIRPGARPGFGHRHAEAEELYVVLSGTGRIRLDEEVVDLRPMDAVRVAPPVMRELEAGPDGMVVLAFGTHVDGDAEMQPGWWS
ncbi:MAG TPA: cupin domain-containing protein [Capillimicrobium sp.]|nr:cupin domain-containing protein [Capillimicrobium sp.]